MIETIYVFANMGHLDEIPKSGGQSSARRVMNDFKSEGFTIKPIRRHRAELQSKIGHILEVGYFAIYDLSKAIVKMLFGNRKDTIFMQMTYAGALVPYELILTITAQILGYKTIEYLQGGLIIDTYPRGSKLHKWLFKKNIDLQSIVLFEGEDALNLTKKITDTKLLYFPSYIQDKLIPKKPIQKPIGECNICYFGRINKVKNVDIIINTFNIICKTLPDTNCNLTLIGGSDNKDYRNNIVKMINQSDYKDRIKLYNISPFEFLQEQMTKQHFYLFPTIEKAEGHSNALNEAMSYGLIPITSNYHFNASIIGNKYYTIDGYNPIDYANKIIDIYLNRNIQQISEQMYNRVKNNYTYSIVNKKICKEIKTLA